VNIKEMSVHRALRELKTLDKRINNSLQSIDFVVDVVGNKQPKGYNKVEDYENEVKSKYTQIQDLIKLRNLIKREIILSNATTKITINNIEMTVAEAIEMKSSIDYKKSLLLKLQLDYRNAINEVERKNNNFESRLNSYLESIGKNTKLQDEETKKQIKTFTDNNEAKLLDTLLIKKEINKLQEEIEVFESEVDLVLSESNAVTILFKNNGE
jgi:hypothetical protein